jgi:DNA adenine methylase
MGRLVEPFAGSAALSVACAARGHAREYWLNDFNQPLAELLNLIVNQPEELADAYQKIWHGQQHDTLEHYYRVREDFNRTRDPRLFLYLLARCVKGAVRYNAEGLFNQSPDKRRRGTQPDTMRANILGVSLLLRGRTTVTAHDYRDVLANVRRSDVVYMDPPYQGVCGDRDARYSSGIAFDDFVAALDELNHREIRFAVSYDGRTGDRTYGQPLPRYLRLSLIELEAGRSTQETLLGRAAITVESLYLSAPLAAEVEARPQVYRAAKTRQLQLLEAPAHYGKTAKRIS